jgi:transcriptional regulator with XRE-family HTH domain
MGKITHIGNRIKLLRKLQGMNQIELSELLNVSQANVSRLESGMFEPNLFQLMILKRVLKTNYDYLIEAKIQSEKKSEKLRIMQK